MKHVYSKGTTWSKERRWIFRGCTKTRCPMDLVGCEKSKKAQKHFLVPFFLSLLSPPFISRFLYSYLPHPFYTSFEDFFPLSPLAIDLRGYGIFIIDYLNHYSSSTLLFELFTSSFPYTDQDAPSVVWMISSNNMQSLDGHDFPFIFKVCQLIS